jgi:hypothetical protein
VKAHIVAIMAELAPRIDCYYVTVPDGAAFPYVLLWGTAGDPGVEMSVAGDSDMSDLLGATVVDTTPFNVLRAVDITRGVLNGLQPAVTGRGVWLSFAFSSTVQEDKTITLPGTNSHPFYTVDRYRLTDTAG